MLCQKKNEKKKVSPAIQNGGNEKKNLKKNRPITSACDVWTRVGHRFCPAIWNGGNGEKDKKKKKNQKWKWVILEIFFQRGSDLKSFLAIGSEKKKSQYARELFFFM